MHGTRKISDDAGRKPPIVGRNQANDHEDASALSAVIKPSCQVARRLDDFSTLLKSKSTLFEDRQEDNTIKCNVRFGRATDRWCLLYSASYVR